MSELERGSCLCGAVTFEGVRSDRGIGVCHCRMCRRQSSGPFFALRFEGGVRLIESRGLRWYASSETGRRGFCAECGSALFWASADAREGDWAVSAGAVEDRPDDRIFEHIHVDAEPGYYCFADDAPRYLSNGQPEIEK